MHYTIIIIVSITFMNKFYYCCVATMTPKYIHFIYVRRYVNIGTNVRTEKVKLRKIKRKKW